MFPLRRQDWRRRKAHFLLSFTIIIERLVNSLTEISHAHEPWSHVDIVTNWRGYEVYCELEKFHQAGMIEKIFGGGFGAQLDVHGKAYLVTTEPALPFLHNGYFIILMIWGICGCAAYVLMLLVLYLRNRTLEGKEREFWKALAVIIAIDTAFFSAPVRRGSFYTFYGKLVIITKERTGGGLNKRAIFFAPLFSTLSVFPN